jgi:hypothetical protein
MPSLTGAENDVPPVAKETRTMQLADVFKSSANRYICAIHDGDEPSPMGWTVDDILYTNQFCFR